MGRPQPSTSHYPWHALAMIRGRKQVQIKDTSTDEDAVPEANAFNYALLSVPVRVAHRPGIIRRICSFGSSYLLEHPPKSKQFAGYFTGCRVLACSKGYSACPSAALKIMLCRGCAAGGHSSDCGMFSRVGAPGVLCRTLGRLCGMLRGRFWGRVVYKCSPRRADKGE